MDSKEIKVTCSDCDSKIEVDRILHQQIEESIKQESKLNVWFSKRNSRKLNWHY